MNYPSIRIEGEILSPDILERLDSVELTGPAGVSDARLELRTEGCCEAPKRT